MREKETSPDAQYTAQLHAGCRNDAGYEHDSVCRRYPNTG